MRETGDLDDALLLVAEPEEAREAGLLGVAFLAGMFVTDEMTIKEISKKNAVK